MPVHGDRADHGNSEVILGQKSYIRGCPVRNTPRLWNARNVSLTSSPCPSGTPSMLRPRSGFRFAFMMAPFRFPETHKRNRHPLPITGTWYLRNPPLANSLEYAHGRNQYFQL
jgi:hypothetical protein